MINLIKPYLDKDTFDEIRTKKRHQDHDSLLMLTVTGQKGKRGGAKGRAAQTAKHWSCL